MASILNSQYPILGTHLLDLLSTGVSETLTVGNTTTGASIRIYDNNTSSNGYLFTTSNSVLTIYQANSNLPTNIGIGTTLPNPNATLQVQGSLYTSNIGTYNANNTIYFNNINLGNISNINASGSITATSFIGPATQVAVTNTNTNSSYYL